ncbi:Neurotrypsin [Holothuria leucospilota]|uniref:Neurotrypsin n=1 Tax=Holothuria leucospilota TaxID=206669 RepID=A0A9Q1H4T8_HOLLE|nr:Neurotrypsin [Holothuria leucospilota]
MKKLLTILSLCVLYQDLVNGFQTGVVRLVGGSGPFEGRVEIFINGEWGTVDEDPWDDNDADVVCRQLGYMFGGVAYRSAYFGEGSGPIWLDSIQCTGSETNLLACTHETDTSEDSHSEDVGVACNGEVRLRGGNTDYEGRVEIFLNGEWGTVDDDPWDDDDAEVVCRQLGYSYGGVAYRSAHFGEGNGSIWLDDINCFGSESHLLRCFYGTDTSEDSHYEDVGVSCLVPPLLPDADVCSSQPCDNNGQCVNRLTSYICICPLGYNGSRCQNVINPCNSDPCGSNGVCIDHKNDYICLCADGFGGNQCETVLDPCGSNPCEHNGLCIKQRNEYLCVCQDGFYGRQCEKYIDPCTTRDCNSSSHCVHRFNSRFCTCENTGNETILCEYNINPCINVQCKAREECIQQGSSFQCVTSEKTPGVEFETIQSYISLILAISALIAVTVCLVKICKISGTIKQQRRPSEQYSNNDLVQMRPQSNQYNRKIGNGNGFNTQQSGSGFQSSSPENKIDGDPDIYEVCNN